MPPFQASNRTRGGRRIPDQNLWTGEVEDHHPLVSSFDPESAVLFLTYEDPQPDDWEHGLLWLRHGQGRSGAHRRKDINTPRTRVKNSPPTCPDYVPEALATCPRLIEHLHKRRGPALARPVQVGGNRVRRGVRHGDKPGPAYWRRFALGKQPWLTLEYC
ncbi:hypothetical protein GCM10009850_109920 [Nonomuraea monospora]|uniref:Uncharacterized protein n=1 Tax=Nonomuraea monospora TaxID=568818 RepID=A0ABN3D1N7_9ACTN